MRTKLKSLWSAEDNYRLSPMIDFGLSAYRAAAVFKRSVRGVQDQARKLGKPFPKLNDRRRKLRSRLAAAHLG